MRTLHRFIEIDLLRALAIAMMVAYHACFDLAAFRGWPLDPYSGGLKLLAVATASLFLMLSGASAVLLRQNMLRRDAGWREIFLRFWRRGLWVLACGMTVSLATLLFDPSTYVRFGILHLIGVALILMPAVLPLGPWNMAAGAMFILAGPWLAAWHSPSPLLLPLGIHGTEFATLDYFPVFPWLGVVLAGTGLGHLLYARPGKLSSPGGGLRTALDGLWESRTATWISFPGRHSLLIYMVHQPLLMAVLWFVPGKGA